MGVIPNDAIHVGRVYVWMVRYVFDTVAGYRIREWMEDVVAWQEEKKRRREEEWKRRMERGRVRRERV